MIDGIIFDKDGTLFDFRLSWGRWTTDLVRTLAPNPQQAEKLAQVIGFDLATGDFAPDSPVISATPHEIAQTMLPYLPGHSLTGLADQMNTLSAATEMSPAVDLVPLLTALRARGLKIGLATNDTEAPARAHLAAAGILQLFDFVSGCDSGYGGKPAPGQLLAFAAAFGLDVDRVAMVGDSQHDLIAGRSAGMYAVAVLTGIAGAAELEPHADAVLQNINSLPNWIDHISTAVS
ncbi:MAG: HAD family hydrolase [Rhodoferax sp.]|nr:HAD family hydrolase [Pseudorhodobacter sp.]